MPGSVAARVAARMWASPARVIGALVLTGYVGVSFAVRNLYPFSTFDMYSSIRTSASRIVARDEDGRVAEVRRFEEWSCEGPIDTSPGKCGPPGSYFYVPYLDEEARSYVGSHAGGSRGAPVEVVRRIWWLDQPGAPRTSDCLLQRCTAVRR
jgi:hypothetical protein